MKRIYYFVFVLVFFSVNIWAGELVFPNVDASTDPNFTTVTVSSYADIPVLRNSGSAIKVEGDFDMEGNSITDVDKVDGVDVSQLQIDTSTLKKELEELSQGTLGLYLTDEVASSSAYLLMISTVPAGAESSISIAMGATTVEVSSYTTQFPLNLSTLRSGIYHLHFHAVLNNTNRDVRLRFQVYHSTGASETFLFSSEQSNLITDVKSSFDIHASTPEIIGDIGFLVIKIFADVTGAAAAPTLTFYMEGDNATSFEMPAILSDVGVTKITAGTNITVTPTAGKGDVTITVSANPEFTSVTAPDIIISTINSPTKIHFSTPAVFTAGAYISTTPILDFSQAVGETCIVFRIDENKYWKWRHADHKIYIDHDTFYGGGLASAQTSDKIWLEITPSGAADGQITIDADSVWYIGGSTWCLTSLDLDGEGFILYVDTVNAQVLAVAGRGDFGGNISLRNNAELRWYDNGNYVGFEAPALSTTTIWVLPDEDGDANDFLQTNGSGVLGFAAGGGGSPDIVFTYPNADIYISSPTAPNGIDMTILKLDITIASYEVFIGSPTTDSFTIPISTAPGLLDAFVVAETITVPVGVSSHTVVSAGLSLSEGDRLNYNFGDVNVADPPGDIIIKVND